MFFKLLRDAGAWLKDSVQEQPDEIARAFVSAKHAVEIDGSEFLRASRQAQDESLKVDIMRSVGDAIAAAMKPANGSRPTPPQRRGTRQLRQDQQGRRPG